MVVMMVMVMKGQPWCRYRSQAWVLVYPLLLPMGPEVAQGWSGPGSVPGAGAITGVTVTVVPMRQHLVAQGWMRAGSPEPMECQWNAVPMPCQHDAVLMECQYYAMLM